MAPLAATYTMAIAQGREGEAEQVLAEFVEAAREEEEGTVVYAVHRHRDLPRTYVLYERYTSAEAFKAHGRGPRMRAAAARLGPLLDGKGQVEFLEPLTAKGLDPLDG
jgi:quinol monooxygenase YgiN